MPKITRSNPKAFAEIQARLKELGGKVAKAGWFESSRYEDGTPIAYIAAIHEYGYAAGGIPPRPFMRPTIQREKQNWLDYLAQGARAVLRGATTADNILEAVSMRAAADVAKTITEITSPPLKPATIKARLRKHSDKKTLGLLDKPLIDSGKLYGDLINTTINHKVDDA